MKMHMNPVAEALAHKNQFKRGSDSGVPDGVAESNKLSSGDQPGNGVSENVAMIVGARGKSSKGAGKVPGSPSGTGGFGGI